LEKVAVVEARLEYEEKLEAAAGKYLPKASKVLRLAAMLKSWRYWDEHGRPNPSESPQSLESREHAVIAQQLVKLEDEARRSGDYVFFRNYSEACKVLKKLPEGGSLAIPMDTYGAAVVACRKRFEQSGEPPTKRMVQELVECWYREGGKDPVSDHQWYKIWRAPLIAALLRKS